MVNVAAVFRLFICNFSHFWCFSESYVHQYTSAKYVWRNIFAKSVLDGPQIQSIPNSKGNRCVILGIGSSTGWVHAATRVYVRGQDNPQYSDYNYKGDVKGDVYCHWLEYVVSNLEENSALVMDNAR